MEQQSKKGQNIVSDESVETSRNLWEIAVLAFWVSATIFSIILVVTDKRNLILVSIEIPFPLISIKP
jgi:hypothetical protein